MEALGQEVVQPQQAHQLELGDGGVGQGEDELQCGGESGWGDADLKWDKAGPTMEAQIQRWHIGRRAGT